VAEVGAAGWLQMAGIELAGEPAVATLHFKEGRLDAVKVAPQRRLEPACADDLARRRGIDKALPGWRYSVETKTHRIPERTPLQRARVKKAA
jgi:hypothetical protein